MPGAVLGRAQDRGQAVLCHAQDKLQQPLEQRATGRNIQRFNGTHVILLTSPLSGLKAQRAAHQPQPILGIDRSCRTTPHQCGFRCPCLIYAFRPIAKDAERLDRAIRTASVARALGASHLNVLQSGLGEPAANVLALKTQPQIGHLLALPFVIVCVQIGDAQPPQSQCRCPNLLRRRQDVEALRAMSPLWQWPRRACAR